ncbi:ATP-dependent metallopeptidase FtsH/Yme1/Tma family protein [Erysipelotrichaceae bacterium OH741_COT-311]|nr:ATP-dependent zinc metalloprotease FtsH [Erysipelotrichaceae bacterium]MDO5084839.1 ATP-dependent zinc metalloprotease FtsH [Erysipelotrichaceae bacterium]RRC91367.1 ATP-dependent metallopeptidase FtsH/Yme1/Tma family protein [Erysipelotrichaceae bacterium OH741_COT-311]
MNNRNKIFNYLPFLIVLSSLMALFLLNPNGTSKVLNYNELRSLLKTVEVEEVTVTVGSNVIDVKGSYKDNNRNVYFKSTIPNTEGQSDALISMLEKSKVSIVDAQARNIWMEMIGNIVPFIIFGAFAVFILTRLNSGGQNKAFEFSKSRARLESDIKIRFNDVAGCEEEKEEMAEIIEYLRSPRKFAKMGARIPKGILLVGPPGTGKTLLAKAVAGEANAPFYSISGSDFVEMFVGVGASRVRDMFKRAKQTMPCIIFIDEIDAVGRQRGAGMGGGHDEREQTLNQILVEMDGINDNSGVVIIACTNRPDVLDPALLRPGRFDRQITVSLPDRKGREAILKVHARNKKLADEIDLGALAKRTPGFSGADLENVLNEAAILAVREHSEVIKMPHLDEAIDRTMMGPAKKSRTHDEASKKMVAYHEAGHAIIGLFLDNAIMVQKVTIIPRGSAGGYNLMTPKEEKFMRTRKDLMASITSYMGGRVAEEIYFDDITTGAYGDIESATKIARDMVTIYGMSDLGPIQYDQANHSVFLGRDYNSPSNVSGNVAYEIDKEVRKIIDECYNKAKELILSHSKEIELIANALIENETITSEQIENLLAGKTVDGDVIDVEVKEKDETLG